VPSAMPPDRPVQIGHGGPPACGWARYGPRLALALLLLGALWLRVSGHDWDADQHLNADDSYVAKVTLTRIRLPPNLALGALLDPAHSPLNPRTGGEFYVYGTLPLYLVKGIASLGAALSGQPALTRYDGLLQTGRVLAGLADTLTVLLVYAVGVALGGRGLGLGAAALYAGAILPIQFSHFYIMDPFMTTAMTAVLAASLGFVQTRDARALAGAGFAAGLALACKVSAAPVLILPVAAVLLASGPPAPAGAAPGAGRRPDWGAAGRRLLLVAGTAGLGLLLGDPFAILDAPTYLARLSEQAPIQSGATDQWFSRKYVGTAPVGYLGGQLLLLGAGPGVGLAGALGLGPLLRAAWGHRSAGAALLLLGAFSYFATIAGVELKWLRYLLPLIPYLCLSAAALVVGLRPPLAAPLGGRRVRLIALGGLLLSAGAGAAAVSTIFHTPQTQVQASAWIYSHVPPGSRIGIEVTTIALPLPLPGHPHPEAEYRWVRLDPLADQPSPQAADRLRTALEHTDYLVVDLTQAAWTVPRLPWRYPVAIRYYDLLRGGQLGFTPVYTATSYPTLGGWAIPDDGGWVDASFMDSSHPPIRIFHKQTAVSAAAWAALFATAAQQPAVPTRFPP